jgi:HAD superfamily hydrolase (TIGR01509 family)
MKGKIAAIVFDFDGVVVNSEPLYEKAERKLFNEFDIKVPDEDWKYFKGISEGKFYKTISEKYRIDLPIDKLIKRGRDLLLQEFTNGLDYIPGYLDFIKEVKKVYKTGLVTSSPSVVLNWIFEHTKIDNHFEYVVSSDNTEKCKPDPEPYLEIARRLRVAPQNMVIIEDSINGVKSAIAAGGITIGLTTSLSKEDLKDSNFTAESYNEIKQIINSMVIGH